MAREWVRMIGADMMDGWMDGYEALITTVDPT